MFASRGVMVWNLIVPVVYRYTAVLTFPVAVGTNDRRVGACRLILCVIVVVGGLGYYIERRIRGTPTTPVPHERSIIDERSDRQDQQELTASPYHMDSVVPKHIFDRNKPEDLKRPS